MLGGYRRFWEESLDQLDEHARDLKRKERPHATIFPVVLESGRRQFPDTPHKTVLQS